MKYSNLLFDLLKDKEFIMNSYAENEVDASNSYMPRKCRPFLEKSFNLYDFTGLECIFLLKFVH